MSKEICISTTPHETRLAILENDELTEIYYERENEYTLAGSIYKGRVTRVLPGMQSAFVDVGLERDAFLYVTDFLEEQEDGADFESTNGGGNQRRENGREDGQAREARGRQPRLEVQPEVNAEPGAEEASDDSHSPSGTRRWRGRRGRKRGFRARGQHEEAQATDSRNDASPERLSVVTEETLDEEPETAREYRAPSAVHASAPATGASQRILLPGESLSKYGATPGAEPRQPEAAAQPAQFKTNYTPPKPSTLIDAPIQWDGGALMPGESLSRYRGREKAETQAVAPVTAPVEVEDSPEEGHIFPETKTFNFAEVQLASEIPTESFGHLAEPEAEAAAAEAMPEVAAERVNVGIIHEPEFPVEAEEEIHEEVHEFEPEIASASHRIDPVAPSEFRVSSVAEEEMPVADTDLEQIVQEVRESPIEAHSAGATLEPVEEVEEHDAQATEVADQLFGFAPGSGVLEEEIIDEDEYDFEPIHGHAEEHDSEDLEEETLDQAGELGEMVRDTHLNLRVSSGAGLEEDEEEDHEFGEAGENGEENGDDDEDDEDEGFKAGEAGEHGAEAVVAEPATRRRDGDRGAERRGGRRGDRRGGRQGGHPGRGRQGGRNRQSAQTMDLPIISDLLKQGQEILVQIAKEPIAKKGARITSHIALPGRFLVFMPTVNHVGVSRKISSDEERLRLKRILISEKGEASGGFIVRTAADGASEDELRADLRFLISLWTDIKQREEASKAPALIYHDLNLVERVLRDQVSDHFSAIWVDNELEYERTVRFLNRFQPSLVRRVKLYTKETPLFEHFGIQDEITKALKSKVWLKSGGSIVINQTEALVAIDINTGKYVGKTARLEDTILKTNLDAIPEIVRQIRLRDLGGIIVIDFIDMDERKNRHKVMAALEDELKKDRAPSKVLQFNDFGLVAITRKRVKQSLERTLSTPCPICTGTGMVKSPTTVANEVFTEMRKMQRHLEGGDVMLRVNPEVVKTLKANNARWLNELEELLGKTIIVKSDATLHPEQFDIH
ncbi:MAG TPA: Rne/Rng family ribonuclease [Silvibacterium sp.]|nr:Rne/Rng family ribonuclease [Silvibacterium sp.]